MKSKKEKGRQWDGISRPSDDLYRKNFNEIFGVKEEEKEKDKDTDDKEE